MTFWNEVALWIKQLREESERKDRTPLNKSEIFFWALFGTVPAGIALPLLRFPDYYFLLAAAQNKTEWATTLLILFFYVVGIPLLLCWRGSTFSPVRTFLSGLLLACFTWTIVELTFLRNVSEAATN